MLTNDLNSPFCVTGKKVDKGVTKFRVRNNLVVTLHKLCIYFLYIYIIYIYFIYKNLDKVNSFN